MIPLLSKFRLNGFVGFRVLDSYIKTNVVASNVANVIGASGITEAENLRVSKIGRKVLNTYWPLVFARNGKPLAKQRLLREPSVVR